MHNSKANILTQLVLRWRAAGNPICSHTFYLWHTSLSWVTGRDANNKKNTTQDTKHRHNDDAFELIETNPLKYWRTPIHRLQSVGQCDEQTQSLYRFFFRGILRC